MNRGNAKGIVRKTEDLTGKKFGKLTVIGLTKSDQGHIRWACKCDCGKALMVRASHLKRREVESCGCMSGVRSKKWGNGESEKRHAYSSCKGRAVKGFLSWELTYEEFLKLASLPCYYCGSPPSNVMKGYWTKEEGEDFIYQGIDRADNDRGYTTSNCVPCCIVCNKAKSNKSHVEFLAWIIKVYKYSVEDFRGAIEVYQRMKRSG